MGQTTTAGYNARCNGTCERLNQTVLSMLRKQTVIVQHWGEKLPYAVFSYNCTRHESTGFSPYELVVGHNVRIPSAIPQTWMPGPYAVDAEDYRLILTQNMAEACASAKSRLDYQRAVMKKNHDAKRAAVENKYRPGDRVMVRHPASGQGVDSKLKRRNYGPFRVVKVEQNNAHLLPWGRVKGRTQGVPLDWLVQVPLEVGELAFVPRKEGRLNETGNHTLALLNNESSLDISKGRYAFNVSTAFGPWTSQPREVALFSLKTTCGLGPFDRCTALCRAECTCVKLRHTSADVAKSYTRLELEDGKIGLCMPGNDFIGQVRDMFPIHSGRNSQSCRSRGSLASEKSPEKLRGLRIHLDSRGSLACKRLAEWSSQVQFQAYEEVRSGGTEMLKEPFHVICAADEKTFFEHTAAVVHVAEDHLQKTRFFENHRFSGSCMAVLVTLGTAERPPDKKEDLFEQLLSTIKKVTNVQVVVMPPPPLQNEAYVHQAEQLQEKFPELYSMTSSGGSLLQVRPAMLMANNLPTIQIGRYGAREDRRYVNGGKWNKDGILVLKEHLIQVSGHHWLRNVPRATATFPLRQLDQLQLGSAGNAVSPSMGQLNDFDPLWHEERPEMKTGPPGETARGSVPVDTSISFVFPETEFTNYLQPEFQPTTSNRPHDNRLHSTRGGRINRRDAPARSNQRSSHGFDPSVLNDIISALQPGPSSKPHRSNPKRK